jgi:hypothetical protein
MDLSKHRKFYINDRLEFAYLSNITIKNKEKILELFFNSKDWKDYRYLYNIKGTAIPQTKISEDTLEIWITI